MFRPFSFMVFNQDSLFHIVGTYMNSFIGSRVEDNKRNRWDQGRNYFTYLINKPLFVIQPGIAVNACHDGWCNKQHTHRGRKNMRKNKNTLKLESNCRKEKWAGKKTSKGWGRERARKTSCLLPLLRLFRVFSSLALSISHHPQSNIWIPETG